MLPPSPTDSPQAGFFDVLEQLDQTDPLLALSNAIPWSVLEREYTPLYSDQGRRAKPIRLMCGLLMLKQLYNLSDEAVVLHWKQSKAKKALKRLRAIAGILRRELRRKLPTEVLAREDERFALLPVAAKLAQGQPGNAINLLMAACAWNLRMWMIAFFLFEKHGIYWLVCVIFGQHHGPQAVWVSIRQASTTQYSSALNVFFRAD